MMDPAHRRMRGEQARDREPALVMAAHAQRQGAQAAHQEPAVERRELTAEQREDAGIDPLDQLAPAADHARDHVAVAAQIFRGGMHHEVDAMRERLLKDRAGPGVVGDRHGALAPCRRGQAGEILGLEHHAGRVFEIQHLGARQGLLDRAGVAAVDEVDLDVEARQQGDEQPVGVRVAVAHADHAIARVTLLSTAALIAAMPVAKPRAASAPSSAASFGSNAATVGLSPRE